MSVSAKRTQLLNHGGALRTERMLREQLPLVLVVQSSFRQVLPLEPGLVLNS